MRAFNWKSIQISVVIIFKILTKITLDIIRYLYRLLTGFVGIANLSYWLSAHYKIAHREIENKSPTKSVNTKRSARWKLAFIRVGLFGFIGSAATGLISIEKVSNNPDEDSRIQEDVPEDLPPHPTRLCERPARAKSPPTCNFIHHHITLRRQIGIYGSTDATILRAEQYIHCIFAQLASKSII